MKPDNPHPSAIRDDAPAVSVLMAVYNGEAFLEEAVASVLGQTFTDFEVVVIDDGSTDATGDVLRRLAAADPRLLVSRHDNRGLTASLNAGLARCRGRYIARMDGDDVCHPERLAVQVAAMEASPEVVALGCRVRLVDGEGRVRKTRPVLLDHDAITRQLWAGDGGVIPHPGLLVRASAIRAVGGYDERYATAQDLDLYLRLGEAGRLANVPEVLLDYRVHGGSVNATRLEQQDRDVVAMLRSALRRRGQERPGNWLLCRWNNRRRAALLAAADGRRGEALRHAWRALGWRPFNVRSWSSLLIAVAGRGLARRYGVGRGLEETT